MLMHRRRWLWRALIGLAALVVLAQVVPYGRNHSNPPVHRDAPWPSAEAREVAVRACYGCHSNTTIWPWYSNVAPVSWLVASDVDEGRHHLNFSEWDRPQKHAKDAAEEVQKGEMPPWIYRVGHPEARLDDRDRALLLDALSRLAGGSPAAAVRDDDDERPGH
jgi:hypothetical protein